MGVVHYYSHHPAHETPEHHHNHHVLLIPLSRVRGIELTLSECRQREQMTNGGIIITPANVSHSAVLKEGAEFIVLDLEPTFVARSAHELVEPDDVEVVPHFARADPLIYQIGLTLKTELTSDESVSRFYAESLFTALSAHLLRKYSKRQHRIREYEDGLPTYKLNQALEYINAHLDQEIKLADLAKLLGMSQYYFCRLFKQSMGISPYQYLIQQRVEQAKQLLKQKGVAIADIALECGFSSQSHLSEHFRKLTGSTPKAYRGQ